ncbi:Reverse transcriptase domain, partial [Trinorchestia longiramus]
VSPVYLCLRKFLCRETPLVETKRKHFQKGLQKAKKNPKRTWEIIKEIAQYKDIKEEKKFENPLETPTNFNTFFSEEGAKVFDEVSKFTTHKPVDVGLNPALLLNTTNTWKPNPVSLQEIRRILYSLKNTKAVGHDNISLQYIKASFNVTAPMLHLIINTSIATNKFPDQWKHSIIKPLLKAGDINTASNYRPISLLPVLSKILEKIISNQLSTHLDKSNLLHPNQYAYRKHTGTQDALLNITEKIYSDIDNKNVTLLLLLDLSKAFDSVEHTRLLQKISNFEIAPQWFQSYLANRSHAVRLKNKISSSIQNDFGFPQGSILGPLLFSIFINDFPSMQSNTRISMYADEDSHQGSKVRAVTAPENLDVPAYSVFLKHQELNCSPFLDFTEAYEEQATHSDLKRTGNKKSSPLLQVSLSSQKYRGNYCEGVAEGYPHGNWSNESSRTEQLALKESCAGRSELIANFTCTTSEDVHGRPHKTCTADLTRRARQTSQDVHGRPHKTCTADLTRRARQTSQDVHGRPHKTCTGSMLALSARGGEAAAVRADISIL